MTWKSHTSVTAAITYAATLNPAFAGLAAMGSVLPDKVEFLCPWLKHRGNSHSLLIWTGLCGTMWLTGELEPNLRLLFPIAIGGLCHVLEDMLSASGVPLYPSINPKKKSNTLKFPLYKTGQISEYAVASALIIAAITTMWLRGGIPNA